MLKIQYRVIEFQAIQIEITFKSEFKKIIRIKETQLTLNIPSKSLELKLYK